MGWWEAGWSNANRAGGIVFTLAIQTRETRRAGISSDFSRLGARKGRVYMD